MCRWSRRIIRRTPHRRCRASDVNTRRRNLRSITQLRRVPPLLKESRPTPTDTRKRDAKATLDLIGVTRPDTTLARGALSEQDLPQTCCPADWHWEHECVTERNEYTAAMGCAGRERRVGR
ncbi:hypothetical protein MRX96_016405 [Rhipicephalus microplus]